MKILEHIVILLLLVLTSCSGFLDEVDQDKFIPSTADHYAALLLAEFNESTTVMSGVQYMTDEVQETTDKVGASNTRASSKPLYTWQKDIELDMETGSRISNNTAWQGLYRDIAVANYVIELIGDATGSAEEINAVKGEAYFIRAWCYWSLTNLYGEPYQNAEQARQTYGVPLRTDIGVNTTYDKSMLYDCYRAIESDLQEASRLLTAGGTPKSIYHPTAKTCDLLMSRVKLYKKEYDAVVESATKVITGGYLKKMVAKDTLFISEDNPEVLYSFNTSGSGSLIPGASLVVNPDLMNSYDESDLRRSIFFWTSTNKENGKVSVYSNKGYDAYSKLGSCNFRVAEAYLNRAEAYAYLDKLSEAKADILELLKNRYVDVSRIVIPTERVELIRFIRQERFKELCFEDYHRWFDLRRMEETERPEIVHRFTVADVDGNVLGVETYKLLSNDKNYTLSVPYTEKDNNPFIRDYERFDKLPEYNAEVVF